ncbi:MAG: inorganic diphosphatase [bacterium]|nr:inorganic diphosphatase [bacterium]
MEIKILVEIPKGSCNKYEKDEETGEMILDRALHSSVYYPFEYGSVQETRGEDGDPLDAVLFATFPTFPGCVVKASVIGYLEMEDEGGIDHKLLAVPVKKVDPRWAHIQDVSNLTDHQRAEVKEFFEIMKRLEPGKWVKLKEFKSREEAEQLVEDAKQREHNAS